MTATLRLAEPGDLPGIVELYNHYVRETPITFDVDPYTVETRTPWFQQFAATGPHKLVVAVEGENVLGYAGTMPFRPKAAYARSVETTIYVHKDATGRGLGVALYEALFDALRGEPVHRLLAGMTLPNAASEKLHERLGFTSCGVFGEVGYKFGQYWDVRWYERAL